VTVFASIDLAMNYPMPASSSEVVSFREKSVNEDLIVSAIADVIHLARSSGQSLDDVMAEILADDTLLDTQQRLRLGEVVAVAWKELSNES